MDIGGDAIEGEAFVSRGESGAFASREKKKRERGDSIEEEQQSTKRRKKDKKKRKKKDKKKKKGKERHDSGDESSEYSRAHPSQSAEATVEWYERVLQRERSKGIVGTVHASEVKKKYVNLGTHTWGLNIVEEKTDEEKKHAKMFWSCGKCGAENYKTSLQCEQCQAMRRMS